MNESATVFFEIYMHYVALHLISTVVFYPMSQPNALEHHIPIENSQFLAGNLQIPDRALGIVIFAHGSGSGRHSPRNLQVAEELNRHGLGTLLLDLLTEHEDQDYSARFDIPLLSHRLLQATHWVKSNSATTAYPLAYFGASTGAAAALKAAAALGSQIHALVCRGGRPDLAPRRDIHLVRRPTLFIVGALDHEVLRLNQEVARSMGDWAKVVVIPGASHLFEEPGRLDQVAQLSAHWFLNSLSKP